MASDLNRSIKVYIDNSSAMKNMEALQNKIASLNDELNRLNATGGRATEEYQKKEKALQQLNASMDRYKGKVAETERVLGSLSGATVKELGEVRKAVRSAMQSMKRDTDEYREHLKLLMAVEREYAKARAELDRNGNDSGGWWSRAADGFNKYFGIVTSVVGAITGLSFAFRRLAEDAAAMDDRYADVMKTTGMARDEVTELNEAFKEMDTRTSRAALNGLAADAGKLGLTGKEAVLDFVEAGNQINVALGEDLGEGAIRDIGKMVEIYRDSTAEMEGMGLKEKMLGVGSALNELGAASTANEGYLVDFGKRLGGVASQADISIQSVLGYASALDQRGQAVEMAATAFQTFIMKLMEDPAKFARTAGLEVKGFTKLLKEDANGAIMQVLEAMHKRGGFDRLIPVFQAMGLDGARAVGVLSSMAGSVDMIREAQRVANEAFAEGVSITNEYNVKNNTLQAELDKARERFKDTALELGGRLLPMLQYGTSLFGGMVRVLPVVIDFLFRYGHVLVYATAVGGAYVAGLKLQTVWASRKVALDKVQAFWTATVAVAEKGATVVKLALAAAQGVLTGNLHRAKVAWLAMNRVMMTSPWGLALTAIVAIGGALYLAFRRSQELTDEQRRQAKVAETLAAVEKRVSEATAEQRGRIEMLTRIVHDNTLGIDQRRRAIAALKKIIPDYNAMIDNEGRITRENTRAISEYIKNLERQARAKAVMSKMTELAQREMDLTLRREEHNKAVREHNERVKKDKSYTTGKTDYIYSKTERQTKVTYMSEGEQKGAELNAKTKDINREQQDINAEKEAVMKVGTKVFGSDITFVDDTGDDTKTAPPLPLDDKELREIAQREKKALNAAMEVLETKHMERMTKLKQEYVNGTIKSETDFNAKTLAEDLAYYSLQEESLKAHLEVVTDAELKRDIEQKIAQLRGKRIDMELRFRTQLEKIILDADPVAKEKVRHEEALAASGLAGKKREELTVQQQKAMETLEATHQENLKKIREDAEKKRQEDAEKAFEERWKVRKSELEAEIEAKSGELDTLKGVSESSGGLLGNEQFDLEVELHRQKLAMIEEELAARRAASLDISDLLKKERDEQRALGGVYANEYKRRVQVYSGYGEQLGNVLGKVLAMEKGMLREFANTMVDILFDMLTNFINMKMAEATATAITAQSKATAESLSMPDSVATFGAAGIARKAVIVGLIAAGLAATRTLLKGVINRPSDSGGSGSSSGGGSGAYVVNQAAEGKYDVIGRDDGRLYRGVPYKGLASTGVVGVPTLVGERGSELVVSHPDFMALQRHVNYPLVVQAIRDVRSGYVPQRAAGKYEGLDVAGAGVIGVAGAGVDSAVLERLTMAIEAFNGRELQVNYYEMERAKGKVDLARSLASKR